MSALLESLAASVDSGSASRPDVDALVRAGLPDPRNEAWKYTPLRALERRVFEPATAVPPTVDPKLLEGIPAPRLVFVNGAHDAALSSLDGCPDSIRLRVANSGDFESGEGATRLERGRCKGSEQVFARLGRSLSHTGAVLDVASDTHFDWGIHWVFIGAGSISDQAWHLRNRISIGANARVVLVEHHIASGEHAHLANVVSDVGVAAGAQLTHVRVQREAAGATLFLRSDVDLAESTRYLRFDVELGAGLSRHDLHIRLGGKGAQANANGVLLATGRRHLDTQLAIEHVARNSTCDLTWHGLASDRGRVVFHGGIAIRAGADGSDAKLASRNLLLSDAAEIDAQPVLEIHADEVKAAHGATVGRLDPAALFYLRSRGLGEPEARTLMTAAFCRAPLATIEDAGVREAVVAAVDAALSAHALA